MKYHCFKNIPHCHWWKFRKGWKGWCSFKPQLAPWKGESLRRARHAVILRTAYRPASFLWASGELNLTETSSPPRFFREGFVQVSTEVRRPFHLDAWDQAPGVQRMLSSGQLELAELKDLIGSFQMTLTFSDWNCKMSSLFLFSCGCHLDVDEIFCESIQEKKKSFRTHLSNQSTLYSIGFLKPN